MNFSYATLIANIPALLIGFAVHEYAHAWMADRLGDPTPRSQGRLTLNPLVHLDFFGALMALFFRFGWAKPVMTQPQYYRGDKRRGHMMVAAAGPIMNFIVAFVTLFLWYLTIYWFHGSTWISTINLIFEAILILNLCLGVFNLIPIPPLDGFSILTGLVPQRTADKLYVLEQYGFLILIIVLITGIAGAILSPVVNGILAVYKIIITLILSPFLGA